MGNTINRRNRGSLRAHKGKQIVNAAVCEAVEKRQLLSGLPIQNDIASLTAYTTVDSVATTQAQLQTPSPFPFDNGQPKNELIQPDAKHLVSGYYNGNWAIARYNTDGTLDLSFGGGDGKATVDFGTPSDRALTLHLQPDGKIVLMGLVGAANDTWTVAAARLNADGTLDSTFADSGKLLSGLGRAPTYGAVWSILNDGRIHITGWDGGKSVGMEYNSDGKDGFDRLAAINEIHASSAQPSGALSIQPPARGTIGWYGVRGQALGPYIVNGGKLRAQDIGLTTGDPYEAGLPDGTGRTLSWGDGTTDSVADSDSSATHTYTSAGTFMTTATGQWASLGGQMSFHPTAAVGEPDASGPAEVVRADDANLADGDVVDLDNHDLVIDQPTASFTTVQQWVWDGFSDTVDPDKTGIISTAGQSAGGAAILALFDNSLVGESDYPAGSGDAIGSNAIVGKYTYIGDTNWDGQVDGNDYTALDANFGRTNIDSGLAWFDGDINNDGMITGDDYGAMDPDFGLGTSGSGTPTLVAGSDDAPLSLETAEVADGVVEGQAADAPSDLSISNVTKTSLQLTWSDNSTNETGFEVFASTDNGETYSLLASVAGSSDTGWRDTVISDLAPDTLYALKVSAIVNSAVSDSEPLFVRTARDVVLENPSFETAGSRNSVPGWSVKVVDSDPDYESFAEVQATGDAPDGSNTLYIETHDAQDNLTNVQVSQGTGLTVQPDMEYTAWITYKQTDDPYVDPTFYPQGSDDKVGSQGGWYESAGGDYTTFVRQVVTGDSPDHVGEPMDLRITSAASWSEGRAWVDNVKMTVRPLPPPVPQDVQAAAVPSDEDRGICVTWEPDTSATGYMIRRYGDEPGALPTYFYAGGSSSAYTDTSFDGVSDGGTFLYQVSAIGVGGSSAWSTGAAAQLTALLPTIPANVYAVPVAASDGIHDDIRISWEDVSANTTKLLLERDTTSDFGNPTSISLDPWLTQYLDTGLPDGTYYYRLTAQGVGGDSVPSNVTSAQTPATIPDQVESPTVLSADDGSNVVEWLDESHDETGFEVWRSTSDDLSGAVQIATVGHDVSYFNDTSGGSGTYYYGVRPIGGGVAGQLTVQPLKKSSQKFTPAILVIDSSGKPVDPNGTNAIPDASRYTFKSGEAVHAQLGAGQLISKLSPLSSRFTWDFGDSAGSDAATNPNTLHGFNAAHIFNVSSTTTFTITCVVTNPADVTHPMTGTTHVIITADDRTKVYVANPNSGGSQPQYNGQPTVSLQTALSSLASSQEILLARGETFTLTNSHTKSETISLDGKSDVLIGSYALTPADASKPIPELYFTTEDANNSSNINHDQNLSTFQTLEYKDFLGTSDSTHNLVIKDVRFETPFKTRGIDSNGNSFPTAANIISQRGSNILLENCQFGYVNGMADTGNVSGLMLSGNTDVPNEQLQSYMLYTGGDGAFPSSIVLIGNTMLNGSQGESDFRLDPHSDYDLLYNNTLYTDSKSPLRLTSRNFVYAYQNTLRGSGNWLGPLSGSRWGAIAWDPITNAPTEWGSTNGNSTDATQYLVFDSNTLKSVDNQPADVFYDENLTRLNPGLMHAVIRNNIFQGTARLQVREEKYRDKLNVVDDVWVVNNTHEDPKKHEFFEFILDGSLDGLIRVKNFHFANNLVATTHGEYTNVYDGVDLARIPQNYPTHADDPAGSATRYPIKSTTDSTGSLQPRTNVHLTWRQELTGSLPTVNDVQDTSRWWIANNVWGLLYSFRIDGVGTSLGVKKKGGYTYGWNSLWNDRGGSPNDLSVAVRVNAAHKPISAKNANFSQLPLSTVQNGSRSIYGVEGSWSGSSPGTALQVAAWDYLDRLRPTTAVTAGAVDLNSTEVPAGQ